MKFLPTLFLASSLAIAGFTISALPALAVSVDNPLKNPAAAGGASTVVDVVVGSFYGFVTLIAVFGFGFLVVSGFKMILARDNPEAITAAKNAVVWSVLGLGAAILSVTIILSVNALLGGASLNELNDPNTLKIPLASQGGLPSLGPKGMPITGFLGAFIQVISNIAVLAFIVCALMVIWAGYQMVMSAGNEEKIIASRTIILWALAGMAVIIFSYVIVFGVNRILENLPGAGGFTP